MLDVSPKHKLRIYFSYYIVVLVLEWGGHVRGQSLKPAATLPTVTNRLASPEAAVHEFLLAMVGGDKKQIEECTLDVPGRDILTGGGDDQPPPEARQEVEAQLKNLPLTRLKVGQQITLPGGKILVMTSDMVNESRQQLTGPDMPFPFIVVKEKDQWKVDPTEVLPILDLAQGTSYAVVGNSLQKEVLYGHQERLRATRRIAAGLF